MKRAYTVWKPMCVLCELFVFILVFLTHEGYAQGTVTHVMASTNALMAEMYDPGVPQADSSYHGAYWGSDGKVYFTLSAHSINMGTRIYRFDPKTRQIELFWTPQSTTPEKDYVAQGKIHSPLAEYGKDLILATHTGHYRPSHKLPDSDVEVKPYKGGYVYAVDIKTGEGRIVAAPLHNRPVLAPMGDGMVPLGGEALICSILDTHRGLFYAVSWPSAIFIKVDIQTGHVWEFGPRQGKAETVPRTLEKTDPKTGKKGNVSNPEYQRCLRTLGLDDKGNVYGSAGDGRIWKYDLQKDKIVFMKSRMQKAHRAPDADKLPMNYDLWRTIVWDKKDKVFYGIHWGSGWLFRLDPEKDVMEPILYWAPAGQRVMDYAQLGLAMGPHHTLYGLVHTPRLKPNVQRSVHLLTLNLDGMRFKDHGHILTEAGMTVMFAESCAVSPDGNVYAPCWVEIPAERHAAVIKARTEGEIPEVKHPAGHLCGTLRSQERIPPCGNPQGFLAKKDEVYVCHGAHPYPGRADIFGKMKNIGEIIYRRRAP